MQKSLTRTLYLVGLVFGLIGVVFLVSGLVGHNGNPAALTSFPAGIGLISAVLASALILVAWIGALIKTVQLQRWGWFVALLILSGITLLVYSFAGPEIPPGTQA